MAPDLSLSPFNLGPGARLQFFAVVTSTCVPRSLPHGQGRAPGGQRDIREAARSPSPAVSELGDGPAPPGSGGLTTVAAVGATRTGWRGAMARRPPGLLRAQRPLFPGGRQGSEASHTVFLSVSFLNFPKCGSCLTASPCKPSFTSRVSGSRTPVPARSAFPAGTPSGCACGDLARAAGQEERVSGNAY